MPEGMCADFVAFDADFDEVVSDSDGENMGIDLVAVVGVENVSCGRMGELSHGVDDSWLTAVKVLPCFHGAGASEAVVL